MDITLSPKNLCGNITDIIASKSLAHRALICAAFADSPTVIKCNSSSDDIRATVGVLRSIGAKIDIDGNIYTVTPVFDIPQSQVKIDFGESGSTMRFMIPVLGALGINAQMITHGRLTTRPLSPLYEELVKHGMVLSEQGKCPLYCHGRLEDNNYTISGNVSSQFISGLMFALAVTNGGTITVKGKLESASYVELTIDMLEKFGVSVTQNENVFTVHDTSLTSPKEICIEGDWSNAAFWLCAGALSEKGVTVSPISSDSIQGDKAILDALCAFGAGISYTKTGVCVRKNRLTASDIDASDIPDLVPVISVVAAMCSGTTVINNISRLRYKESDRVATVREMLGNLGIKTQADENTLTVFGGKILGGTVDSHNDHRIAMSAAVASCVSLGDITITNAQAVSKSYPDFFEQITTLGAVVHKKEQ
ncbi:MAG: 3-phosphoshikimate 1-carboxyvinyltransferase [Ruminococcaceae bacterium]|nr:3-phosphoshikimate 1-carboxyvinyltransferase [Oscillospiraceae bacterium]